MSDEPLSGCEWWDGPRKALADVLGDDWDPPAPGTGAMLEPSTRPAFEPIEQWRPDPPPWSS